MLWTSTARDTVEQSYLDAKDYAEVARQRNAEMRLDMLKDNWKEHLLRKLQTRYASRDVLDDLGPLISTEHNVLKRIATELSTVYKWGATRELADPKQEDIRRRLYDEAQVDEVLELANLYLNVLRDIVIVPRIVDDRMQLDIQTPDGLVVIQNPRSPSRPLAWCFESGLVDTPGTALIRREWATEKEWIVKDQYGEIIERRAHGLGRMPGIPIHASPRLNSFFEASEFEDVVDANMSVGCDLVMMTFVLKWQSQIQPAYEGDADELPAKLIAGARRVWTGKGRYYTLDLTTDPERFLKSIKFRIGSIAQQHGLAADVYDLSAASSASSGFQIRLRRLPLLEARARQLKIWRRVERELLTLMALVSQDHPLWRLDPMAEFKRLDFHEEPMLEDPKTQNDVWEKRIGMGLMSKRDVFMEQNPDLSREQAAEEQRRVRAERAEEVEQERALNMPKNPADPGRSPEDNGARGPAARAESEDDSDDANSTAAQE